MSRNQRSYPTCVGPQRWRLAGCAMAMAVFCANFAESQSTLREELSPFLSSHCFHCHSGDAPKGQLDLQSDTLDVADPVVRRRWVYLFDRVARGEMPPSTESQPGAEERRQFLQTLRTALTRSHLASRNGMLRRLNRREYENTVRDMFGIFLDVKRLLPEDAVDQGFDTSATALSVSGEQMTLYLEAADLVLDQVFGPDKPPKKVRHAVNFATTRRGAGDSERKLPDGVVLFSGAKFLPLYDASLAEPGLYRVRVKVRSEQTRRPVIMHVLGGSTGAIAAHTVGFFEAPVGRTETIEFMDRSIERHDSFAFGLVGGFPWWSVNAEEYKGPGLFIGDIEIEGPVDAWPPVSRASLLGEVDVAKGTLQDIRTILARHSKRAFRRVTTDDDVAPYVALAERALGDGLSFEKALRRGLKGMLCAPEFLFLQERSMGGGSQIEDDFVLASRLSYFFWSSLPDDELLSLAEGGELSEPEILAAQTERLLKDPKAARFVASFTDQWLRLIDIDFTVPDAGLYPEYNQLLRQSMIEETRSFFQEILDKDESIQTFVDSDFLTINGPQAEFYGIEGVTGLKTRRVKIPKDSARGGVLTQASVLKVSADGTRTSPVLRGAWILKHLYGAPSPPPPPSVGAIEPDIRGAKTIREQLAKHREHESCDRCHRKIDPPGFALESFDVIGAERDWYRIREGGKNVQVPRHPQAPKHFVRYRHGADVDPSGAMPDGRAFADVREYKQLLLEDETALPVAMARILLSYSLGRQMGFSDRPEIEQIVAKSKNYGLRSLVHQIVQSKAFRNPN